MVDAVDKLVELCGFKTELGYVTKQGLETSLEVLTPKLLDEIKVTHGYIVRDRLKRGIHTTSDLLCLLRRVLRKRNQFILYTRYKEKGKTKYKYFIK